jgi:hypothetical protein
MEELEQFIREEWDATDLTYIDKLRRSMPRRLQLLLENEGRKIAYSLLSTLSKSPLDLRTYPLL